MEYLFILLAVCLAIVFLGNLIEKKTKASKEKAIAKLTDKLKQQEDAFNNAVETYGSPSYDDDVSVLGEGHITLFPKVKKVLIGTAFFDYADIHSIDGQSELINSATPTKTVTHTKHHLGSAAGRAVAGAIIAGPVGAVIGGVTGKTTSTTETVIGHDDFYFCKLNIETAKGTITFLPDNLYTFNMAKEILERAIASKAESTKP